MRCSLISTRVFTRVFALLLSLVLSAATLRAQAPVVSMAAATYTFNETEGTGAVTVNRSGNPSVSFSVNYTAVINDVTTTGTVIFGPNELSKVLALPITNDHAYQGYADDLRGVIQLQVSTGVTLGAIPNATINIIEAELRPQVSLASVAVAEGDSGTKDVLMTVTLSGPFSESAEFYASVSGGTATLGSDYESGYPQYPGSQQFVTKNIPARQTSATFYVRIYGDTVPEPDETILIYVYVEGSNGTGVLTILNDDYLLEPPPQPLRRGTVGSLNLTTSVPTPTTDHVELSSSDTNIATVPPFVDIPAGSLGKSFAVTAVGNGSAVIMAKMPPSRAEHCTSRCLHVHSFDALCPAPSRSVIITLPGGRSGTVMKCSSLVDVTSRPAALSKKIASSARKAEPATMTRSPGAPEGGLTPATCASISPAV